jgi:hypothetical protein
MVWRMGALVVILAVGVAVLWLANCSGPQVVVTSVEHVPPPDSNGAHRVTAYLQNVGGGHGQVSVKLKLRDPGQNLTAEDEQKITLEGRERSVIVAEIKAPLGTYVPQVEVEYPPR